MTLTLSGCRRLLAAAGLLLCLTTAAAAVPADADVPFVRLQTGEGEILLALFPDLAPHHVRNFTHLAETGFYDGTTFHRVIPGFVIQGGDPLTRDRDPRNDGQGGPTLEDVLPQSILTELIKTGVEIESLGYVAPGPETRASLKAEFSPTAKHLRGTLSMARSRDEDSAGSQFFICVDATPQLDRQYTVFGQVVTGLAVADTIVAAPTGGGGGPDHPVHPVPIESAEVFVGVGKLTPEEQAAYREMLATLEAEGSTW